MWYHNKLGNAIYLENAISYYKDKASHSIDDILVDIETVTGIRTYLIETIDIGSFDEFIDWIVTFFRMGKEVLKWENYLDFREKVLPTMKENSINWEEYEKSKNKNSETDKQLTLFNEEKSD